MNVDVIIGKKKYTTCMYTIDINDAYIYTKEGNIDDVPENLLKIYNKLKKNHVLFDLYKIYIQYILIPKYT